MIKSFGDNGFSVCHAGHCDWQRPHSVQVDISNKPFQVMSARVPKPNTSSSLGSSKLISSPCDIITGNAPSEDFPSALRRKKILNGAKKRCHATPIVKLDAITMNQAIDPTILIVAII